MNKLDAASVEFVPILAQPDHVIEAIRQLRNSQAVREYMYSDHEISREEHAAWLARLAGDDSQRVMTVGCQGQVVGLVSLSAISARDKTASWAFYLSAQVQGMGIGGVVEFKLLELAFNELGLEKLNCEVLASNMKVVTMHQKFGFQIEGKKRANVLKDCTRMDVVLLGMLAAEWAGQRPRFLRLFAGPKTTSQ
jgi:UDP-4-amino-4,6-dideoxy-N-acetyl-beta-L-altrosamine N-acetyltransferase